MQDVTEALMTMKLDVNWGARNSNAKYRLAGKDLGSVAKELGGRDEWGKFDGKLGLKWRGDAQGNATRVRISPAYTITLPTWPQYRKQPQSCKDAWDTMLRALKKHEDGHKQIFTQGVTELVRKLEALRETKGSEVEALLARVNEDIQAKHDRFDRETDHGRSRGVELVISGECKPKAKRSTKSGSKQKSKPKQ